MGRSLRETVRLVAALNLGYFGVEFAVALGIGSVSLFADSIDFLEDTSINFLILIALSLASSRYFERPVQQWIRQAASLRCSRLPSSS